MKVVFALLFVGASAMPQFNGTKCPAYWELQTPHMSQDFNIKMLEGFYYEVAFHDATQFPLCPNLKPRCITSAKAIETYPDGQRYVNDTWDLQCFGVEYPQTLLFNETDKPGFVNGYVPVTKIPFLPKKVVSSLVFPNTIVDFKAGPHGYSLEMQCVEFLGRIVFVGINYYTKEKTEEAFQQIDKVARAQGLGYFLDKNEGVHRVNHTGCPNEPKVKSETVSSEEVGTAEPAKEVATGNSTCAKPGDCGLAYQACCAGFAAKGFPCGCHLKDGDGKAGADCGTCGSAYSVCCAAFSLKGFPCTCDIDSAGQASIVV